MQASQIFETDDSSKCNTSQTGTLHSNVCEQKRADSPVHKVPDDWDLGRVRCTQPGQI